MRTLALSKHHSSDFSPRSLGSHTPTTPTRSDTTLTLTPTTPNSGGALTPVQPSPPIKSRLEDKISKKHRRTASIETPAPKVSNTYPWCKISLIRISMYRFVRTGL